MVFVIGSGMKNSDGTWVGRSQEWIEDRAEQALLFLSKTDEEDALYRMEMVKAEAKYKAQLDAIFTALVDTGSIEDRKARSRKDETSLASWDDYLCALEEFHNTHNKRESQRQALEWCRSLNANRRQGQ